MVFEDTGAKAEFLVKSGSIGSFDLLRDEENGLYLSVEDADLNQLIALLSALKVRSFSNRNETLEDYFMKFYKEDKDFGGALQ